MKLTNALSIDKIMFDPNNPCLFCNSKQSGLAAENDLAYAFGAGVLRGRGPTGP